jgi:hypothetical protein
VTASDTRHCMAPGDAACVRVRMPRVQVQKLHDQYVAEVDRLRKVKDAELKEDRTHSWVVTRHVGAPCLPPTLPCRRAAVTGAWQSQQVAAVATGCVPQARRGRLRVCCG